MGEGVRGVGEPMPAVENISSLALSSVGDDHDSALTTGTKEEVAAARPLCYTLAAGDVSTTLFSPSQPSDASSPPHTLPTVLTPPAAPTSPD